MSAMYIHLDDLGVVSESHPDYQALTDWMIEQGIASEWIKIPSDIKVTQAGVTTTEYWHDADGKVRLLDPDAEHPEAMLCQKLYETTRRPEVPAFKKLEVDEKPRYPYGD